MIVGLAAVVILAVIVVYLFATREPEVEADWISDESELTRDEKLEKFASLQEEEVIDECARCGHEAECHWFPGTEATTTACIECMFEQKVTQWTTSGRGYVDHERSGICDHTAEWVRNPW